MPASIVVGAQWGDEGKGKVVDAYAAEAGIVIRFQGGNNAGHTIKTDAGKTVLHLVPSGILHPGTICVIANGTVVDLAILVEEIEALKTAGVAINGDRLYLHPRANLILPWHKQLDAAREEARGKGKIGTTCRGIGPAYEDKVARVGVQAWMLETPDLLRERLHQLADVRRPTWDALGMKAEAVKEVFRQLQDLTPKVQPFLNDPSVLIDDALRTGSPAVLFEGAQGALLDIDYGTYPYVTSSNTLAGGAATGAGVGPRWLHHVVGVFKAYTTRVGEGPFPTEIGDVRGEQLRTAGGEFGATTGRPRRCGWLDLPALRYVIRHGGLTLGTMTKLDVLSDLDSIPVCVAYELNGERLDMLPMRPDLVQELVPVYEEFPGWKEDISAVRDYQDLPVNARKYLEFVSREINLPYASIGVGQERDALILIRSPYNAQALLG